MKAPTIASRWTLPDPPPGGCWGLEDWSTMTGSWTGLNWR
jgi:hypothetical protein